MVDGETKTRAHSDQDSLRKEWTIIQTSGPVTQIWDVEMPLRRKYGLENPNAVIPENTCGQAQASPSEAPLLASHSSPPALQPRY